MTNDSKLFYGEVVWFSAQKGYGFISWEKDNVKQKEIFVHFSDVDCIGFKTLNKGQKISFEIGVNKHGDPKAICVTAIN